MSRDARCVYYPRTIVKQPARAAGAGGVTRTGVVRAGLSAYISGMTKMTLESLRALLREELAPIRAQVDAIPQIRAQVDGIPLIQRALSVIQQESRMMKAAID